MNQELVLQWHGWPWLAALITPLVLVAVYRGWHGDRLSPRTWLRPGILLVLLLSVLAPTLVERDHQLRPPRLELLLDTSASMAITGMAEDPSLQLDVVALLGQRIPERDVTARSLIRELQHLQRLLLPDRSAIDQAALTQLRERLQRLVNQSYTVELRREVDRALAHIDAVAMDEDAVWRGRQRAWQANAVQAIEALQRLQQRSDAALLNSLREHDASMQMIQTARTWTRSERARQVLETLCRQYLPASVRIGWRHLRPDLAPLTASAVPAGGTDLGGTLRAIHADPELAGADALIVISDGRQTVPGDLEPYARALRARGSRIDLVQVGGTSLPDASIAELRVATHVHRGGSTPIQVRYRLPPSLIDRRWYLQVLVDGELRQQHDLWPKREWQELHLECALRRLGSATITARLHQEFNAGPIQYSDRCAANDSRQAMAIVHDQPQRMLLIDRLPRWETRHLAQLCRQQAQLHVSAHYLQTGRGRAPVAVADVAQADLIVLGDVSERQLGIEVVQAMVERVQVHGAAVIAIAGSHHMPGDLGFGQLAQLVPVLPDDSDSLVVPAPQLPVDPPWIAGLEGLRPGATVRAADARQRPLLVSRSSGVGQVVFLATDQLWRWRTRAAANEHRSFWLDLLSSVESAPLQGQHPDLRLALDRPEVQAGEQLILRVESRQRPQLQALDEQGRRIAEAVWLRNDPVRSELWRAGMRLQRPGPAWIVVRDEQGREERRQVLVRGADDQELIDCTADADALTALAAHLDGRLLPLAEADRLFSQLATELRGTTVVHERRYGPWTGPWMLMLLIALLALDWWSRQQRGGGS
ncbi:MAG: hypothetical protein ACOCXJ_01010 [Planctomycetota bacterium]